MKTDYDNAYSFDNVYGHAVELLRRHRPATAFENCVHLDLGCGYGRIADAIQIELGRHFVGVDVDAPGVESLRSRGFESHQVDLSVDAPALLEAIEACLRGRGIASISLIDVLEHVPNFGPLLSVIRELARQHGAIFVLSVPNITHRDVGFKLAFGRYDVTNAGLLDHTHVHWFTQYGLRDVLAQHGLHVVERNDVKLERSDQSFPALHPAIASEALLGTFLRGLRSQVDSDATSNQLIAACLPGPIELPKFIDDQQRRESKPVFLTIVTRTQGRRPGTLRDVLLALSAQTRTDFELIVVGHKLSLESQLLVERILADSPESLRDKIRFIRVDHGNRTAPLNAGFFAAKGEYVSILDDDDLPMAHWIETFSDLASGAPGRVLRVVAVKQEFDEVQTKFGQPTVRTVSGFQREYPGEFDLLDHMRVNRTPPIALAFPRSAFSDMGIHFDESLTTTEDWDFMMRVVNLCGIESSPAITCIYRWWNNAESSRSLHSQDEWRKNHDRILAKMDTQPLLMPAGTTRRLRDVIQHIDWQSNELAVGGARLRELQCELVAVTEQNASTAARIDQLTVDVAVLVKREAQRQDGHPLRVELAALLNSTSWKVTAPLRRLRRMFNDTAEHIFDVDRMSTAELDDACRQIRSTTSWRVTAPMRALARVFSYR